MASKTLVDICKRALLSTLVSIPTVISDDKRELPCHALLGLIQTTSRREGFTSRLLKSTTYQPTSLRHQHPRTCVPATLQKSPSAFLEHKRKFRFLIPFPRKNLRTRN